MMRGEVPTLAAIAARALATLLIAPERCARAPACEGRAAAKRQTPPYLTPHAPAPRRRHGGLPRDAPGVHALRAACGDLPPELRRAVLCAALAQPGAAGAAEALRPLLGADLRAALQALEATPSTTLTASEAAELLGAGAGGCPALARLSLPGLRAMGPAQAKALALALPALADLDLPRCAIDERCLRALAPVLPRLRRLNISGCRRLRDFGPLKSATALTSLDMSGAWHLPVDEALYAALRLPSLVELRLRDVGACEPRGDGSAFACCFWPGSAPALEILDVAGTLIGGVLLAQLAAAAPRLASLDVSRCLRLGRGLAMALAIKVSLPASLAWPPPAEAPGAGAVPLPPPASHLTALMAAGLPARAPAGEFMAWTHIDSLLTDDPKSPDPPWGRAVGWRAVAAGAEHSLAAAEEEERSEGNEPQLLGTALGALLSNAAAAAALRCLDLSGAALLRDDTVALIAGRCAGLASLSLADTPALTDAGLATLSTLSALSSLDLTRAGVAAAQQSGTRRQRDGAGVGDAAVAAALAGSAATLRRLGLGGLPLTAAALRAVGACSGLRALDVSGCSRLGDHALLQLASISCPRLAELRLSGCSEATPAALPSRGAGAAPIIKAVLPSGFMATESGAGPPPGVALRAALERLAGGSLTSLTVEGARGLTDADVAGLVAGAPGLRTLKLLGAEGLGDGAAVALAAGAPALRKLALTRSALTASGLEALGGCPRLNSLNISRSRGALTDAGILGFLLRRRRPWAPSSAPPALPAAEALLATARRFAAALPATGGQPWLLLSLSTEAAVVLLEAWSALLPAQGAEAAAAAAAPPLTSFFADGAADGKVTAAAVVALGAFAPELEALSLRDCTGVSGSGVQAAALLMPLLREARWGGAAAAVHAPPWLLRLDSVSQADDFRLMMELTRLFNCGGASLANVRFSDVHTTDVVDIEASPLAASVRRPPADVADIIRFQRRF